MRPLWLFALLLCATSPGSTFAGEGRSDDRPFGMTRRQPWNESRVVGSPDPPAPYRTVRAFPELTLKQPLALVPEPGTKRLFLLQHLGSWSGPGRLRAILDNPETREADAETLLDIDGIAYGLAFHPDYIHNGFLFLGLNAPLQGGDKKTKVVRYHVERTPPYRLDPDSAVVIIEWPSDGHNGGDLAFGPDGFLYVSSGDGTSDSDLNQTGQTLDDLLAAVLRIDVDHPDPGRHYSCPADNPFVARPGARPELWAYGFRNPWRLSYDLPTNQLWVGNNGQDLWEQVYLVRRGANYGWSVSEGSHIFHAQRPAGPDPISPPTAEHHHSEARSLTGGRVYHGDRLAELRDAYLYGDFSTGRVWGIRHDGTKTIWHRELVDTPLQITGFGTDHQGEVYIIDHGGGFYRLEPARPEDLPTQPFPTRLSETGLFRSVASHAVHPAVIPYSVNASSWADGATIARFLALPGSSTIEVTPQRGWNLEAGSVLMQTLSLNLADDAGKSERKRVETRLLTKQQGEWVGYSYRWNEDQSDAVLVPSAGDSEAFLVADPRADAGQREQIWRFPSRSECLVCHSRAANFVLGLSTLQMNRDHDYGEHVDNQLRTFEHIGLLRDKLTKTPEALPRLVDPRDELAPLESRARSYLHANCSSCHVEAGGGNSAMELEFSRPRDQMKLIDIEPRHDRFDLKNARLIAPGEPERSVLHQRISRRGTGQMPPLVTTEVDHHAAAMIADWIRSLRDGQR